MILSGLYTLALMIIERRLFFRFPSSCGDVQPLRTSLVIRTEHNLLNKTKAWNSGVETALLICAFVFFFFCAKNRVSHDAAHK